MKKLCRSLTAILLIWSMLASLCAGVFAAPSSVDIVSDPTGYTTASDVIYNSVDGYLSNWGARGEDCLFLSTYAQDFYTGSYSFETLSQTAGGTTQTNTPSSDLYSALQTLMTDNHTYFTKYGSTSSNDCKYLYAYTDCMSNDTAYVSTLYRGLTVSGAWDGGVSYNQEHVWPQSKCIGTATTDIGDIMQLRPANPSENSSRNNTAYGESTDYYDPGVSVRGDCARTLLYLYVRWGNTDYMWGVDGVIESLDILLQWIKEDPVDTWEMGRNDSVQSITGTRNVFVDYPEYAWLLFGQTVPTDLTSPSGGSSGGTTGGTNDETTVGATLVTNASELKAGDQIIIAALDYDYALSTTQNTNNRGQASVTKSGQSLTYAADTQIITLESGTVDGTFAFLADSQYLYAASSSSNYLKSTDTPSDNASWTITVDSSTGAAAITANGTYTRNVMRYNSSSSLFSCYSATNSQKDVCIYKIGTGSSDSDDSGSDSAAVTLVTDAASLQAGDQIIIAALEYDYALSTTQNTNNRAQAAITKNGDTISYASDAQIITLETGTVSGSFGFQVGESQYLYAPSSSSNQMKTTDSLADNGSWAITIDSSTGAAAISACGTTTRNVMRYNSSSSLFSCYSATNSQKDICIYKLGSSTQATDYYLFGYINGANYACEEDYTNMGIYKFTNGTLTATFTSDSYVGVKTEGNTCWYMTDGWLGTDVTSATLYDTSTGINADKLYVPGNVPVTFELTVNDDGTLTLSYHVEQADVVTPVITLKYPTLSFEDEILLNVYYSASDLDSVTDMGLITYTSSVTEWSIDNAEAVIPGYAYSETAGYYFSTTEGIAAKCLGDTFWFAVYAKLSDGSYCYTKLVSYSPKTYAYTQLSNGSEAVKPLVVAMLNYGAAAQTFFNYNTGALVNSDLSDEQKALVEPYSASMMDAVVNATAAKAAQFVNNGGYAKRYPTVSFEGAFSINYYFTPSSTPDDGITMYVWDHAAYESCDVLTAANATETIVMDGSGTGEYLAIVEGIAAKNLDKTLYVCFCYSSGGIDYCSGVLAYSIGSYCTSQASGSSTLASFAAATAVYGYYAKQLFGA